jgi:hypothetical protein
MATEESKHFLPSNIISTTSTTLLQPTISIPSTTSTAHRNESPEVTTEKSKVQTVGPSTC